MEYRFDELSINDFKEIQTNNEGSKIESFEGELMNIPEVGEVIVSGDPFEIGSKLDENQGDNVYGYGKNCGLVSVHNILTMAGKVSTENAVIGKAIMLGKCFSDSVNNEDNGGTNALMRKALLETYGFPSTIFPNTSESGSLESIASYVEAGHGVNISGNMGYFWNDSNYIMDGSSNHSVVVTGTARAPETGELKGLFVCDSGKPGESSSVFLSVDQLKDAYLNASKATVLVTNQPIR